MSQLTVSTRQHGAINDREKTANNNEDELIWVQKNRVIVTLEETLEELKVCCERLHLHAKCDRRLGLSNVQPETEKYTLVSRQGSSENLKANVSLLGDNVIQAEVNIKYPKAAGGYYRAVAQPDVQWKLQQLQDLGNYISRSTFLLCNFKSTISHLDKNCLNKETGKRMLNELTIIKNEICKARVSIQLPRKRSLLELCYFPPTRKFVPPLPQDQLVSFYISSCRLVCASYQMVPKSVNPQGLSIYMSECQLPHLDEVLKRLNLAMNCLQKLIGYIELL